MLKHFFVTVAISHEKASEMESPGRGRTKTWIRMQNPLPNLPGMLPACSCNFHSQGDSDWLNFPDAFRDCINLMKRSRNFTAIQVCVVWHWRCLNFLAGNGVWGLVLDARSPDCNLPNASAANRHIQIDCSAGIHIVIRTRVCYELIWSAW